MAQCVGTECVICEAGPIGGRACKDRVGDLCGCANRGSNVLGDSEWCLRLIRQLRQCVATEWMMFALCLIPLNIGLTWESLNLNVFRLLVCWETIVELAYWIVRTVKCHLLKSENYVVSMDVTIPIPYWGVCIGVVQYWQVLLLMEIGIGRHCYWSLLVLVGVGIGIRKTWRKCYFEKVMICYKVSSKFSGVAESESINGFSKFWNFLVQKGLKAPPPPRLKIDCFGKNIKIEFVL